MFTSQIKWWLQYPRRSQGILPSQFVRNIQYANGLVKALILRFLSPLYKCPGYLVRRSEHAIPFPSRNIYYHRTHYTNRFRPWTRLCPMPIFNCSTRKDRPRRRPNLQLTLPTLNTNSRPTGSIAMSITDHPKASRGYTMDVASRLCVSREGT